MIATVPSATLLWAGLLGLLMLMLAMRVVARRRAKGISLSDGGDAELLGRIRAFGNFTEYTPLLLILLGLIEVSGGASGFVHAAGALLFASRLGHGLFLTGGAMSKTQMLVRQISMMTTFVLLAVSSIYAIVVSF